MRAYILVLALAVILTASSMTFAAPSARAVPASQAADAPEYVPGQLLVMMKDAPQNSAAGISSLKSMDARIKNIKSFYNGEKVDARDSIRKMFLINFPESLDVYKVAEALSKNPMIEVAEPNYIGHVVAVPNDPVYPQQWGLQKIQSANAFDLDMGNNSLRIAIIDTGIDMDHPDLAAKIEVPYDWVGWNVAPPSCSSDEDCNIQDSNPQDIQGHGTETSGVAAAITNNVLNIAGSCPDCRIVPIRACYKSTDGKGLCATSDVIKAIDYARTNASVKVISMSFTVYHSSLLNSSIRNAYNAGITLVAAAGNNNNNLVTYPAGYSQVISVAATEQSDYRTLFSTYGFWVNLAAPGIDIMTTTNDGSYTPSPGVAGTSFSAPMVAGVAALMKSQKPTLTNTEIKAILQATADPVYGFPEIQAGRVNAFSAMLYIDDAPALNRINPINVNENQPVVITATATDPNPGDVVTYSINDARFVQNGNQFTWNTNYDDSGSYIFEVTASDGFKSSKQNASVTVNNVNRQPQISLSIYGIDVAYSLTPINITINEGQTLSIIVLPSDPDNENIPTNDDNVLSSSYTGSLNFEQHLTNYYTFGAYNGSHGQYALTFNVSDGFLQQSQQVNLKINDIVFPRGRPCGNKCPKPALI